MTRFVITAINKDGQRTLAEPRQGRYTYDTHEIAQQKIKDIFENTSADTIASCMGNDLQIRPVSCFITGDSETCWFD